MKYNIKNKFNHAADYYDQYSNIQEESADQLINIVSSYIDNNILSVLDVGAGTGSVTLKLFAKYGNRVDYYISDISDLMLDIAKRKLYMIDNLTIYHGDSERLLYNRYYDFVIANMSLQWFDNLPKFIEKISKYCKFFAFAIPIDRNFSNIEWENNYLASHDILGLVRQYKTLHHSVKSHNIKFDTSIALINYLRKIGAYDSYNLTTFQREKNRGILYKFRNKDFVLNYEIIYILIRCE